MLSACFGVLLRGGCGDLVDEIGQGGFAAVAGCFTAALDVVLLQEPELFHEDHGVAFCEFEIEVLSQFVHGHYVVLVGVAPALQCEEVAKRLWQDTVVVPQALDV